ncbi:hypothetical protein CL615_04520 [archaeon]|mgnify:FL=1|jgi:Fe-S-cluster containining protein|nr:hypothetical protein [archaeon]MDP6548061.1 YkgJ family cysteine cluster protein [Candidatus Woesearchaeota archaeon]|tara:strand:- start:8734 stop:9084 length:351 start_codon:yes stop_codon:yes gene_type:complete
MLTKENFKCSRYCAKCCKDIILRVNSNDIKRIMKTNPNVETFLQKDPLDANKLILKKENNKCIFLEKKKDGKYACIIYSNRPEICKKYPFFDNQKPIKSCLPNDVCYSTGSLISSK